MRVNAQLIDAQSGAHLWADRFEEDASDLFKLQDQVVARLANSLGNELVTAEGERGGRTQSPDAIDLVMRGRALLQVYPTTRDNNDAARALFERALAIDPNNAAALAGDAHTYTHDFVYGWTDPQTDYDAKIIGQADRALALARDTMEAYVAKASYLFAFAPRERGGRRRRRRSRRRSKLCPSLCGSSRRRNWARPVRTSQVRSAASDAAESARSGEWVFGIFAIGDVELGQGHNGAGIDEIHKAIEAGFRNFIPYADLAAAYALDGRMDEAKSPLAEARRLNPNLTMKWFIAHAPNVPMDDRRPAQGGAAGGMNATLRAGLD